MYPLLVATKSQSPGRRNAAFAVSVLSNVSFSFVCLVREKQLFVARFAANRLFDAHCLVHIHTRVHAL